MFCLKAWPYVPQLKALRVGLEAQSSDEETLNKNIAQP